MDPLSSSQLHLLNTMMQPNEPSPDIEMISQEVEQIRMDARAGRPPFSNLTVKCRDLTAIDALSLCQRYFSCLDRYSSLSAWLPPWMTAEVAVNYGARAYSQSTSLQEKQIITNHLAALFKRFPRSEEMIR
jgi:hypothetical protein